MLPIRVLNWLLRQPPKLFEADDARGSVQRGWRLALVVALVVACFYAFVSVSLDNTNLGTTNGLWKSVRVHEWERGTGTTVDTGGYLYYKLYGNLVRLIPDSLVRNGSTAPMVTFRKMALLNALFSGIASGCVFLLALRFAGSWAAGLVVVLVHSLGAFVLMNSVNSEDIIPAYACFTLAAVCFFEFIYRRRAWLFLLSACCFAFATLLHWTMMAPGLAAFGLVYLMLALRSRDYFALGFGWLVLFLAISQLLVLAFFPARHFSIWDVVYPAKTASGGWIGFQPDKLIYFLIGTGNYFSGGYNLSDYRSGFANRSILRCMEVSWAYAVLCVGACLWTLLSRSTPFSVRCFALFGIAVLVFAEAGNLYSQPQDPQMQIQPMFSTAVGMILLARYGRAARPIWRSALAVGCVALAIANGYWNLHLFARTAGDDGRTLAAIDELARLFPPKQTLIVSHGFEVWVTWQFVVHFDGDSDRFHSRSLHLAGPFTEHRGMSAAEAAAEIRKRIDSAMLEGIRVVANSLWTETPDEFAGQMTTVAAVDRVRAYDTILRKSYHLGQRWQTQAGTFVELLP